MTEPRYQTRISDPDETTRIPREALDELRDADLAKDGPSAVGPSTGSTPAQARPAESRSADNRPTDRPVDNRLTDNRPAGANGTNGSAPVPRNGAGPASGPTPVVAPAPDGRPSSFRSAGSGTNGSGVPAAGPIAGLTNGSGPTGGAPGGGTANGSTANGHGSAPGYRRSETGYSPSAYPSTYGTSQFSSLADAPTTITGPGAAAAGVGLGTGAAANTAAARSALGAATATRPSGPRPAGGPARPTRRARLLVRHVDPWSMLKFSFVLAVAMFFVWLVAVGVLYGVLDGMGVFEQINGLYDEISGDGGDSLFSPGTVLGIAALIGVGQHRPVHRASHHRCLRLQHLLRPGRRHRGHARRAGLSGAATRHRGPAYRFRVPCARRVISARTRGL